MFHLGRFVGKRKKNRRRRSHHEHVERGVVSSEWIVRFSASRVWVCSVEDSYVNDNFNLCGLSAMTENYSRCLAVVRGSVIDQERQKAAENLYGLIHARYLLTYSGARKMIDRFENETFGVCPRVRCRSQALLPIGLTPVPGTTVKTFCPCCEDIYDADSSLDGSFFGPYFPQVFLQFFRSELKIETLKKTPMSIMGVPLEHTSKPE